MKEHKKDGFQKILDGLDPMTKIRMNFQHIDHDYRPIEEAFSEKTKTDESIYRYVCDIATSIWKKHYEYKSQSFVLLDDTYGVLTQIDNMVSGMIKDDRMSNKLKFGDVVINEYASDDNPLKTLLVVRVGTKFIKCLSTKGIDINIPYNNDTRLTKIGEVDLSDFIDYQVGLVNNY